MLGTPVFNRCVHACRDLWNADSFTVELSAADWQQDLVLEWPAIVNPVFCGWPRQFCRRNTWNGSLYAGTFSLTYHSTVFSGDAEIKRFRYVYSPAASLQCAGPYLEIAVRNAGYWGPWRVTAGLYGANSFYYIDRTGGACQSPTSAHCTPFLDYSCAGGLRYGPQNFDVSSYLECDCDLALFVDAGLEAFIFPESSSLPTSQTPFVASSSQSGSRAITFSSIVPEF